MSDVASRAALLAHLPPAPDEAALLPRIRERVAASGRKLVVIDDDPTGIQTVYNTRLLTAWDTDALARELTNNRPLFFVLTNSRSRPAADAVAINCQLAAQLRDASARTGVPFVVASRSDSTLRGHYPAEIDALDAELGPFDGHLIVPAFLDGGRVTISDTHYVATPDAQADALSPAHLTPFAQDTVFGYTTAYLPAWVAERSAGRWRPEQVVSLSLELIRHGAEAVAARLATLSGGAPIIVNAASYGDLAVVALGTLLAEAQGKRFVYRTAADFVRLRSGLERRPLLAATEILGDAAPNGGLLVVGSYVPGSTAQLDQVLALPQVAAVELPVARVLESAETAQALSRAAGEALDQALRAGKLGVLYTSRTLATGATAADNLAIGRTVSQALIDALHAVTTRPRFIIAKGGITSHDIAQKGLGATQSRALGQLLPGVPVWRLEAGTALRFPGVPYIVFPGNVGGPDALARAVETLMGR